MSPLFITPQPLPTTDRSTPEGQEPDRNDTTQCDHKKKKHTYPQTSLHSRYSLTDTTNYDVPNQQNSALRKYVLLVHDCIAIKFTKCNDAHNHLEPNQKYPDTISDHYTEQSEILDGIGVFKCFIESNKKCHWNTPLCTSITSLEYKGYVHPSTILVTTSTRNMSVLRNAWSRRILRDPPGYRAEFLGEIEEIVAQPVQQGQFAPLSDSLCWAIAELTEAGQEAFINSIQSKLQSTFPSISQPPKELIFQTLEKLIREQKIYQTSRGYYIVTPDISSYINYSRSVTPAGNIYGRIYSDCYDKPTRYSTPWSSTPSVPQDTLAEELRRILTTTQSNIHLKRHNSLKIIRNRQDNYHIQNHPSMGARSLSFRLSKCNSLLDSDDNEDELENTTYQDTTPPVPQPQPSNKKRPSILTRLFKFRCASKPKQDHPPTPPQLPQKRRPRRRQRNPRSSSPSSSVSGIYASITTHENITKTNKRRSSLYDLHSPPRWNQTSDATKNESSDVSH